MAQKRRKFKSEFKAKVVLEALKERDTIEVLAKKFELSPTQISTWKSLALANFQSVFGNEEKPEKNEPHVDVQYLYAQIGQMKIELDFLKKKLY